jgi:hypothetical protein
MNAEGLEIVIFDCGCIGSKPDVDGIAFLLSTCDSEDGAPGSSRTGRQMNDKAYEPMFADYIHVLLRNAQAYHDLQQVKQAVRVLTRGD